jgi:type IV pilus assembly protein PilN
MFQQLIKKIMSYLSKLSVEQEDVVGIDITPTCIRVAQLESGDKDWTLTKLGYKYIEESNGLSSIKENPEEYISKLKRIVSSNGISTINAAVSIPVSSAIIKVVNLPLMTDEELQEAVDTKTLWENSIQLADSLEEYSIFWQVLNRNTTENQMDLLFVASKLEDIEQYLNIVSQAGLKPVVVDVRCFAIRNALELRKDLTKSKNPVAIVEFGEFENYIMIVHEGSAFISDIYLSEKDRNLLSSVDIDKALLRKVAGRYAMQLSQMLSSYQSKYKIQPIDSILITSALVNIDSIVENLQEAMNSVKIQIFCSAEKITLPENIKEKLMVEPNPSAFSSVLGLATRKLDVFGYYEYVTGATSNINLLPDRDGVKNQEKVKFLSRWAVVIFVIISFIVGIWSYLDGQAESEELAHKISEYETLMIQKEAKKIKLTSLKDQKAKLSGMLKASSSIVSNQKIMHAVLLGINSSVPQGVSLNSIEYQGDGKVVINGLSISDQNILQFIENLAKSSAISKSSLLLMSVKKVKKRTFKLFTVLGILADQKTVNKKEVANGH